MSPPLVTIIVLNWNRRDLTLQCLRSLDRLQYENVTLLVVDNGSRDGSLEAVEAAYPRVQRLALPENSGFARGNNAGLELALKAGPDWIMFLNNDTEVAPDLVSALVAGAAAFPQGGIFGPKIYYGGQQRRIWYAGGEVAMPLGRIRHRGIRTSDHGQYDLPGPTDYVTGACLLIRAQLARTLGGFDTAYPMYMEDVDLCTRARRLGAGIIYLPAGTLWHHVSSSIGGEASLRKAALKLRSSLLYYRRYARPWHWPTILLYQLLYYLLLGPLRYLRSRLPPA